MKKVQQLLLVESSMRKAFAIVCELEQAGLQIDLERVETAHYMQMAISAKPWDFIICDSHLVGFSWFEAMEIYERAGLEIPFVLVAGSGDEVIAVERIKNGMHERLPKVGQSRMPSIAEALISSTRELQIQKYGLIDPLSSGTKDPRSTPARPSKSMESP